MFLSTAVEMFTAIQEMGGNSEIQTDGPKLKAGAKFRSQQQVHLRQPPAAPNPIREERIKEGQEGLV